MAGDLTGDQAGVTPLEPEELEQLIPEHLTMRKELDDWEDANIAESRLWSRGAARDVLDDLILRELHRRMFDGTWVWAGSYRETERNIGIDPLQVPSAVRNCCEDAKARLKAGEELDEVTVWFHHRLVRIHPFPNGNGRWAREAADLLLIANGGKPFDWGGEREDYIAAVKAGDQGDLEPLRRFVRP